MLQAYVVSGYQGYNFVRPRHRINGCVSRQITN